MGWTVTPWLAGIVTQMRSQNKAILAQLIEHSPCKREVIRLNRIDGTIVIGRSIRLATEAVLKTVELVTLALGVRLSHLPPPTIAASEGLTLVSYASWERDRYPRPHPKTTRA